VSSVRFKGTLDDDSDKDTGWIVEMAVPRNKFEAGVSELAMNAIWYDSASGKEDSLSESDADIVEMWKRIKGL
jgi:hypothetical protein